MKLKKNWFYQLSISLSVIGLLYIAACVLLSFGQEMDNTGLYHGTLLSVLLIGCIVIWGLAAVSARAGWVQKLEGHRKAANLAEALFIIFILLLAVYVRIRVVQLIPVEPSGVYQTNFEIAKLLLDGNLQSYGSSYCDYVAMFPQVMGYCYILKLLFQAFGVSVAAAQGLNIVFSVATAFFIYRAARLMGGRAAGIPALLLCAFWPSQVLYVTMLTAEYAASFFLFLCIWLFLFLVMHYDGYTKKAVQAVLLHLVLGVLLSLTVAIRPAALIFLIAIVLLVGPQKMELPPVPKNDLPLMVRLLERGWLRCILILIPYIIISAVISTDIELAVDRTLPALPDSFGYSLLAGLNTEKGGSGNADDSAFLYSKMEDTGSAVQAQIACRAEAVWRFLNNPAESVNLLVLKYEKLWSADDFAVDESIMYLKEQGGLTKERGALLAAIRDVNHVFYAITVFFALVSLLFLWHKKAHPASLLAATYLGTALIYLFLDNRNRYHFLIVQMFMLLAGTAVSFIFGDEKEKRQETAAEKQQDREKQELRERLLSDRKREEDKLLELRREAFANLFDMDRALKEGHIIMTVSEACRTEEAAPTENSTDMAEAAEEKQESCQDQAAEEKAVHLREEQDTEVPEARKETTAPEVQEDTTPEAREDTAPEAREDTTPEVQEDTMPEAREETVTQDKIDLQAAPSADISPGEGGAEPDKEKAGVKPGAEVKRVQKEEEAVSRLNNNIGNKTEEKQKRHSIETEEEKEAYKTENIQESPEDCLKNLIREQREKNLKERKAGAQQSGNASKQVKAKREGEQKKDRHGRTPLFGIAGTKSNGKNRNNASAHPEQASGKKMRRQHSVTDQRIDKESRRLVKNTGRKDKDGR